MFNHLAVNPATLVVFYKLGAAIICGALIGTERVVSHKEAGMRTYALVAMGSALFVVIIELILHIYVKAGITGMDPFHIPAAIISGIGFVGAGMIIFRDEKVSGLTTASGFWVTAGIGMACGYGFYIPAFMATLMTLFVFIVLWHIEQSVKNFIWKEEGQKPQKKGK